MFKKSGAYPTWKQLENNCLETLACNLDNAIAECNWIMLMVNYIIEYLKIF